MKILDIGCGPERTKHKGSVKDVVIGLDRFKAKGVNVVWNLEKTPLPFKNNEFDVIYCNHVLEHVKNLFPLMDEIWRILKPNGKVVIRVPHFSSGIAFVHPEHIRYFTAASFWYFTDVNYAYGLTKHKFKILKRRLNFAMKGINPILDILNYIINPIINIKLGFYEKFLSGIIKCDEIIIEMKPVK